MWPRFKETPNDFIGKLWFGIRDRFKSAKNNDVTHGEDLTTTKDAKDSYIPLEQFLNEKKTKC